MFFFNPQAVLRYLHDSAQWEQLADEWNWRLVAQLESVGYEVVLDDVEKRLTSENYLSLRRPVLIEDPLTGALFRAQFCLGALVDPKTRILQLGGIVNIFRGFETPGVIVNAVQLVALDIPWKRGFLKKFLDQAMVQCRPLLLPADPLTSVEAALWEPIALEVAP